MSHRSLSELPATVRDAMTATRDEGGKKGKKKEATRRSPVSAPKYVRDVIADHDAKKLAP